jgi:hypothetical protein
VGREAHAIEGVVVVMNQVCTSIGVTSLFSQRPCGPFDPAALFKQTHHRWRSQFCSILRDMAEQKTERSNCRFAVQQASDGKSFLVVQLYQDIPSLKGASIGFDLLGGTRVEAAKKLAEALNEHVLNMFVAVGEKST